MKKVFLSQADTHADLLHAISYVLEEEEVSLFRADALQVGDELRSEILAAIRGADICIAVMDGLHPNVLFELGYALGAGKKVLLLRSPGGKIPFDVATLPVLTIDRLFLATASKVAEWVRNVSVPERRVDNFSDSRALFEAILSDPELLDGIAPRAFEERVADFFDSLGFITKMLPSRNDQGFDVLLSDENSPLRIAVEIKKLNRNSRVAVSDVQRVVGAAFVAATAAMIVTAGGFTSSAHYFSDNSPLPVLLLTLEDLVSMTKEDIVNSFGEFREPRGN